MLRDNARDLRYAEIMKALAIEQVERTVRIRWTLPPRVVLALSLLAAAKPLVKGAKAETTKPAAAPAKPAKAEATSVAELPNGGIDLRAFARR